MSRGKVAAADSGFALVDALFAAALLAFAGLVIAAIGTSLLQRLDDELRRSSALATLDMMARILRVEGVSAVPLLVPSDDQNFHFEVSYPEQPTGSTRLRWIRLEAHPKGKPVAPYLLDLLVPAGAQ
jgi:hypothetical protein